MQKKTRMNPGRQSRTPNVDTNFTNLQEAKPRMDTDERMETQGPKRLSLLIYSPQIQGDRR